MKIVYIIITDKDDDGVKISKGEICINDIKNPNTDITYKILENILIKYLFPIGSKVSLHLSSGIKVPDIEQIMMVGFLQVFYFWEL